jgi:APA family basic amino acid/polyamine antiporter
MGTEHLSSASNPSPGQKLAPKLGRVDATALVVSNVIGVGIFTTPAIIASIVPHPGAIVALWFVGGLLAFAGAVTYSELGKLCPEAGGEYVYLSRAFGPLFGFLSGWTSLVAGFSGALAASAVALVSYLGRYSASLDSSRPLISSSLPWTNISARSLTASGILVLFAIIHIQGWKVGKVAQRTLAVLVIAVIVVLIVAGFLVGHGSWRHFVPSAGPIRVGAWLLALVPVMFTYSGWNAAAYVSEEIRDPKRNLGWALCMGTAITMLLYLALNLLYLYAIPVNQMNAAINVGDIAAQHLFSVAGGVLTPILVVALAGCISAMTVAGPRVYFAMSRDGAFPKCVSRIHPKLGTPAIAIALQTTWSIVLVMIGGFEQILLYTGFAVVLSSGAAAIAQFVLCHRTGKWDSVVRNVLTPALFAVSAFAMLVAAVKDTPRTSLIGLGVIAAGVPVFCLMRWNSARLRTPVRTSAAAATFDVAHS